jgi:hypothetical protein
MFRCFARSLLALVSALLVTSLLAASLAWAHDSWISRGSYRNAVGEWCCGEGDCFLVPVDNVHITSGGYALPGAETVPFNEAQPSPDGAYWRCQRPDGTRRCFFAPPTSY